MPSFSTIIVGVCPPKDMVAIFSEVMHDYPKPIQIIRVERLDYDGGYYQIAGMEVFTR